MKSALLLTLIMCLVGSALPVAAPDAQEKTETTAGPLARAVTREAVRLAAVQLGGTPAESNWSRVRGLAPGTEVIVTVHGSPPGTRSVVLADESQLTVLNVTDPTLSTAARKVLLDLASNHPGFFAADEKRGAFVSGNVRVGPDGVFVADRKVADLGQVVEKIARNDVAEIKAGGAPTGRKRLGLWAAIPGAFFGGMIGGAVDCSVSSCGPGSPNIPTGVGVGMLVGAVASVFAPRKVAGGFLGAGGGFVAGGLIGAAIEGHCRPDHPCDKGVIVGAPIGAIAGGVLGYRMSSHKTEGVIYYAP